MDRMTRLIKKFDRNGELDDFDRQRFCGWLSAQGINPVDTALGGCVVVRNRARLSLSVQEYVKDPRGGYEIRGDRVATRRRTVRIDSLPRWVEAL